MDLLKKVILVFAFLLMLFWPSNIMAQTSATSSATGALIIPGVTCGDAESSDPQVRRCCLSPKLTLGQRVSVPGDMCLFKVGDFEGFCLNSAINKLTDWVEQSMPTVKKFNDEWLPAVSNQYNPCINGNPSSRASTSDTSCVCQKEPPSTKFLCNNYLKNSNDYGACLSCSDHGVWTSLGCVDNNISSFIQNTVFGMGIGLAGGFALLCIVFAAFQMQSSQGNPEKIKKAQEMLTSCIMGLMLIIFSVFILRLIGVSILKIPGF